MPKATMTAKERWLAVLNHQLPDKVPVFYRATEEVTQRLLSFLGCNSEKELFQKLHIDPTVSVGPKYVGPSIPSEKDVYGITYANIAHEGGSYREAVSFPLAEYESVEAIDSTYQWPSIDWWDFTGLPSQAQQARDSLIVCTGSEPFLTYCNLRGREQAYLDLILNPEIVHYCLDKLFDFCYERLSRIFETIPGKVNMTGVAEDLGSQTSLLMSPKHIEEFLLPRMKRMMDLTHQGGAKVIFHSDGAVRQILPTMIDAGVDVLDPVQWRCPGMERDALKRDFGQQLVFHGGMDNQYTLAFGSVNEVVTEVRENLRLLGANGGYCLGPCHAIQVVSPPENIVAMYEEAYSEGWY